MFGGIALFLVWKSVNIIVNIHRMEAWVPIEARLLHVRLDTNESHDDNPDTFRAIVSYQYQVGDSIYTGERLSFGYFHSNMDRHYEISSKLKYARKVRIWVDPDDPQESAMAQGWSETALFFVIFSLLWVCGAIAAFLRELGPNSPQGRAWVRGFVAVTIAAFVLLLGRVAFASVSDDYVIKLEEKIKVIEYLTDEEIERERLIESATEEAFRRAAQGQDTFRVSLPKKTIYIE